MRKFFLLLLTCFLVGGSSLALFADVNWGDITVYASWELSSDFGTGKESSSAYIAIGSKTYWDDQYPPLPPVSSSSYNALYVIESTEGRSSNYLQEACCVNFDPAMPSAFEADWLFGFSTASEMPAEVTIRCLSNELPNPGQLALKLLTVNGSEKIIDAVLAGSSQTVTIDSSMSPNTLMATYLPLTDENVQPAQGQPAITNVSFTPRYPWNGLVDIAFTLEGDFDSGKGYYISLTGYDRDRDETVVLRSITGQTAGFASPGTYHVVWDASADCPKYSSSSFQVIATLHAGEKESLTYLVIDLSGGAEAESYPYRYSDAAPDLDDDTCRTTELWLRRIPKGTFLMGSPEDELGRSSGETQHQVTLTQDYYIGVFE
ncbi:MAG: hypothetical protein IKR13_00385, partial [Victivallales bacterium]|nr:hypothetical protein [Victivallales bacterium]